MTKKDNRKQSPFRKSKTSGKRTLIKNEGNTENAKEGTVVATVGTSYIIRGAEGELVEAYLGGTVISQYPDATVVVVGDRVHYLPSELEKEEVDIVFDEEISTKARIVRVNERKTRFSRKSAHYNSKEQVMAANIDSVIIFMSCFDPDYNKKLIDRYIVACEIGEVEPIIVINKYDLTEEIEGYEEAFEEDMQAYDDLGYKIFPISVEEEFGLEELSEAIQGKTTLITGPSGVGKSSFVNKLLDGDYQDVGYISERTGKGLHTTSSSRMFSYGKDGFIIDSPGIRELAVWGIEEGELQLYYHDFDEFSEECKYPLCTHVHEPECGVKEAVEEGQIDPDRYYSYLNFLDTL
ncbi:MAG: ribosome small subunit-dependent GTPase A [Candidatus Kapaibacteriales bacterium]